MSLPLPPLFSAWRQSLRAGYGWKNLRSDLSAGLTVGIIAIPLAMALAIAVGVAPQHGLYTVLVAGTLIALFGGSRFNVSGPTAAFVVILLPVTQQFGLGGLLLCTLMAGMILITLGLMRAGRLIEFIPYPVTLGFTAGIGIVIATLQIKDLFGLQLGSQPNNYIEQLNALLHGLNGVEHPGIPPFLPSFIWPWHLPGADSQPLVVSFELFRQLLAPAFAIAMLGAIESLLCAVVADGMTGSKHDPNGELIGQGIGNLVAPFFGGITATAAIARSAANVRAGAYSPLAAIAHAGVVLIAILFLAPLFSYLPMAALAALLLVVAWNMSEPRHVRHTLRIAPRNDVLVLLTCPILTVLFDMVLAVGVGLLLAAGLFIKRMSDLTDTAPLPKHFHQALNDLPEHVLAYAIRGPLFFGAAEKALSVLRRFTPGVKVVIVDISAVPLLDMTAIAALDNVLRDYREQQVALVLSGPTPQVRLQLRRAGIVRVEGELAYVRDLAQAKEKALRLLAPKNDGE